MSSKNGPIRRVQLPPGGSTLMTSAPSAPSNRPTYSACSSASSTTRVPASGVGSVVTDSARDHREHDVRCHVRAVEYRLVGRAHFGAAAKRLTSIEVPI